MADGQTGSGESRMGTYDARTTERGRGGRKRTGLRQHGADSAVAIPSAVSLPRDCARLPTTMLTMNGQRAGGVEPKVSLGSGSCLFLGWGAGQGRTGRKCKHNGRSDQRQPACPACPRRLETSVPSPLSSFDFGGVLAQLLETHLSETKPRLFGWFGVVSSLLVLPAW